MTFKYAIKCQGLNVFMKETRVGGVKNKKEL